MLPVGLRIAQRRPRFDRDALCLPVERTERRPGDRARRQGQPAQIVRHRRRHVGQRGDALDRRGHLARLHAEGFDQIAGHAGTRPLRMARQIVGHRLALAPGRLRRPPLGGTDTGEDAVASGIGVHGSDDRSREAGAAGIISPPARALRRKTAPGSGWLRRSPRRTPGADSRGRPGRRTSSSPACPTAWRPAAHCSGPS